MAAPWIGSSLASVAGELLDASGLGATSVDGTAAVLETPKSDTTLVDISAGLWAPSFNAASRLVSTTSLVAGGNVLRVAGADLTSASSLTAVTFVSYREQVLSDSPLAYYRLSESSGTSMVDSSGNGHNGSYVGSPTLGATGLIAGDSDTAMVTGSGQYATAPSGSWITQGTVTVDALIKPTSIDGSNPNRFIGNDNETNQRAYSIDVDSSGHLQAVLWIGGSQRYCTGNTVLVVGRAYHVAMTYNGTVIKVYVNGIEDGSTSYSGTIQSSTGAPYIGCDPYYVTQWRFRGTIDEVAFYSGALSSTRIAAHADASGANAIRPGVVAATTAIPYVNPNPHASVYPAVVTAVVTSVSGMSSYREQVLSDSPLAYYRLNETSGSSFSDDSGHGRTASLTGSGTTLAQSGALSNGDAGLLVNGSGGITIPHSNDMDTPYFTLECWAKFTSFAGNYKYIFTKNPDGQHCIRLHGTDLQSFAGTSGGFNMNADYGGLTTGVWYHLVLTWDGSHLIRYINGSAQSSLAGTGTANTSTANWTAGAPGWDGGGMIGYLDEVAYYGTALSPARIAVHYNASFDPWNIASASVAPNPVIAVGGVPNAAIPAVVDTVATTASVYGAVPSIAVQTVSAAVSILTVVPDVIVPADTITASATITTEYPAVAVDAVTASATVITEYPAIAANTVVMTAMVTTEYPAIAAPVITVSTTVTTERPAIAASVVTVGVTVSTTPPVVTPAVKPTAWKALRGRQGGGLFSLYYGNKSGPSRHLVESQAFGWNYVVAEPDLVQTSSMNSGNIYRSRFDSPTALAHTSMVVVDDTYRRPHLWHLLRGAQGGFHSQFFSAKGPALQAVVQNRALTSSASRGGQGLLVATSSMTATGSGVFFSVADLVADSSLSSAGQVTVTGSLELSGTSSLVVSGDVTRVSSGGLSQDSALLADPVVTRIGSADLSSDSALTAAGEVNASQGFLSSVTTLSAEGIVEKLGLVDAIETSSLTAVGSMTRVAQADLVAASTIFPAGEVDIPVGLASLSTLSATGLGTLRAGADLTSGSSLVGDGRIVRSGTSFLYSTSSMTSNATVTTPPPPGGGGGDFPPLMRTSYTATSVGPDDDNTWTVDLGFPIKLGSTNYTTVYVNHNGYVTLGAESWEYDGTIANIVAHGDPGITAVFAGFFADIMTRWYGTTYFEYGPGTYDGNAAYYFTWPQVGGYMRSGTTEAGPYDTFQIIIVDQGSGDFDLIYNYESMTWDAFTANYSGVPAAVVGYWYTVGGTEFAGFEEDWVGGYFLDGGAGALSTTSLNSSVPGRHRYFGRAGVLSTEPPNIGLVQTSSMSVDVYVTKTLSQESALVAIPYHSVNYPSPDLYPRHNLFPTHGPADGTADLVAISSLWSFAALIPSPVAHVLQRTTLAATARVDQNAAADLQATSILGSGGETSASAFLTSSSALDAQILLAANAQAALTSTASLSAEAEVIELPRASMTSSSILTAVSTINAQAFAALTSVSTLASGPLSVGQFTATSISTLVALSGSADYPDTVMLDAPYLYWRLEERENEWMAYDTTGNGRHGLVLNAPEWQQPGLIGTGHSYRFNGNNYVEISYNSWRVWDQSLNSGNGGWYFPFGGGTQSYHRQFAVEAVIEPFVVGVTGAMIIAERWGQNSGGMVWQFSISAAGYLQFAVRRMDGTYPGPPTAIAISTTVLQRDQRYYVVGSIGTDLVVRLYVQGQEEASVLATGDMSGGGYDDIYLGHSKSLQNFYGYMDEFAYYDHALTAEQIATRAKAIDSPAAISVTRNAAADLAQTSSLTVAKVDVGTILPEVSALTVNTTAYAQAELASSTSLFSVADAFTPGAKPWAFGTLLGVNGLPWNSSIVGNEPVQLMQASSMSTTGVRTFGGNGVEMIETSTISTGIDVVHFAVALLMANSVLGLNVPSPIILSLKSISKMTATSVTAGTGTGSDALLILYGSEGTVTTPGVSPVVTSEPPLLLTGSRTFD